MEFKGTKGKWVSEVSAYSSLSGILSITIRKENDRGFMSKSICKINPQTKNDKDNLNHLLYPVLESKANALLISKAPEMLEMLKIYLSDLNNIVPKSEAQRSRIYDVEQLIKESTEL